MRVLKLLLLLPIIVIALGVAVSNRQLVPVFFHPFSGGEFPELQVTAPLYLVLLVTLAIGIVIGGIATWFEQAKYRLAARRAKAEVKRLTAETAKLSARTAAPLRKAP